MSINNTSFGIEALNKNDGSNNTAVGAYSLTNNTIGFCNTSLGSNSLFFNVSGPHNTALGSGSMCNNVTGGINTAIGSSALEGDASGTTIGDQNVAVGAQSLFVNNGNQNTALGTYSLLNNTDGSNNVALGFFAGSNNISGSNNTFVGSRSGQEIGDTNIYEYATAIGAGSKITNSNNIVIGRPLGEDNVEIPGELNVKKILLTDSYPPYPSEQNAVMPKEYIDSLASGIIPIGSSTCIANNTLSPVNLLVAPPAQIDGYTLQDGDKVLINDQANLVDNGIWIANIVAGNWSRPAPGEIMSVGYDAKAAFTFVTNGTTYGKSAWVQIEIPAIVGTNNLLFNVYYQFNYQIGQGLEVVTVGSNQVLQVQDNLNFLENITVSQNITSDQTLTGNNGTFNKLKLGAGAISYGNNSLDISGNTLIISDVSNVSTTDIGYNLGVISSSATAAGGVINTSIGVLSNGYQMGLLASRGATFESVGDKNFFGLFQDARNNGNYNPIVKVSDHILLTGRYGTGVADPSGGIVICPWSSKASGARMDPSGNFTFYNQLTVLDDIQFLDGTTINSFPNYPLSDIDAVDYISGIRPILTSYDLYGANNVISSSGLNNIHFALVKLIPYQVYTGVMVWTNIASIEIKVCMYKANGTSSTLLASSNNFTTINGFNYVPFTSQYMTTSKTYAYIGVVSSSNFNLLTCNNGFTNYGRTATNNSLDLIGFFSPFTFSNSFPSPFTGTITASNSKFYLGIY